MIKILFTIIFYSDPNFFPQIFSKMKRGAAEAVIYGCIRGLNGTIPDCKLGMHTNCFNEIQQSMILDPCSRQSTGKECI